MTVKELKKKLIKGYRLKDLFDFSDGQDCIIYKSDFEITDDIIYIPDIDLNEINIDTKLNKEEIKNILNSCYTGNDFVEECNGYKDVAEELFEFVDSYEELLKYTFSFSPTESNSQISISNTSEICSKRDRFERTSPRSIFP